MNFDTIGYSRYFSDSAPNVARLASKRPEAGSRMRKHPENGANRTQASKRRQRSRPGAPGLSGQSSPNPGASRHRVPADGSSTLTTNVGAESRKSIKTHGPPRRSPPVVVPGVLQVDALAGVELDLPGGLAESVEVVPPVRPVVPAPPVPIALGAGELSPNLPSPVRQGNSRRWLRKNDPQ
jgi:hypothetical protein